MYRHLLVPTDGSRLSTHTVGRAVAFAKCVGAMITFVSARSDYGATDRGALERTLNPACYSEVAAGDSRGFLAEAEAAARAAGVKHQSVARTSDRPYEVIIEVAEEQSCDLIFMASHGRKGLRGLFLGSQTERVLAHSRIPVLVCSVESNQPEWQMNSAVATIQQEHRSLAAVIHGLRFLVREVREAAQEPNFPLFRAMLHYIEAFPESLHHPKEERYVFRILRERTPSCDEAIAELIKQHAVELELVAAVSRGLREYENNPDTGLPEFAEAVDAFAEAVWAHMSLEEKVILPSAMTFLRPDDWAQIAAAFEENGDPRFDRDTEGSYKKLFARIMNLAPDSLFGDPVLESNGDG